MRAYRVIEVLLEIVTGVLGLLSLLVLITSILTTVVFRQREQNDLFDFQPENIGMLVLLVLATIIAGLVIQNNDGFNKFIGRKKHIGIFELIMFAVALALGLFLIFSIRGLATNDADELNVIINKFMEEENYSSIRDGYLATYPFQIGYVMLGQLLYVLAGPSNFLVYQLLNLVSILLTMYYLYRITCLVFHERMESEIMAFLAIGAWFFYAFSTFVYNDIWSNALQFAAFYLLLQFLQNDKIKYAVGTILCIAFACLVKTNCYIALIAMTIVLIFTSIRKNYVLKGNNNSNTHQDTRANRFLLRIKYIILAIVMVACTLLLSNIVRTTYAHKAGLVKMRDGVSAIDYIAMGMQEAEGKYGWYDGYNVSVYKTNDFDTEKANAAAIENIHESLGRFKNSKRYFVKFYLFKFLSQWADPTDVSLREQEETARHVANQPAIAQSIVFGDIYHTMQWVMNVYQTVIYFFVCCYIIFRLRQLANNRKIHGWKSDNIDNDEAIYLNNGEILIILFIIGGMTFHMFWEASGRYTMRYYLAMLPIAAHGANAFFVRIAGCKKKSMSNKHQN